MLLSGNIFMRMLYILCCRKCMQNSSGTSLYALQCQLVSVHQHKKLLSALSAKTVVVVHSPCNHASCTQLSDQSSSPPSLPKRLSALLASFNSDVRRACGIVQRELESSGPGQKSFENFMQPPCVLSGETLQTFKTLTSASSIRIFCIDSSEFNCRWQTRRMISWL